MRAAEGLHVEWVDDEAVILDQETGTLHYLSPPAALVYALILDLGIEGAIAKVKELYGDVVGDDLDELLSDMKEKGLLLDD